MSPISSLLGSLLLLSVFLPVYSTSNAAISTVKARDCDDSSSESGRGRKLGSDSGVIISGNATILSSNRAFELGFFSADGGSMWYLGIWFASIPTPPYVWVANRENPAKDLASTKLEMTGDGRLAVKDYSSRDGDIWRTENTEEGVETKLLDDGNLVVLGGDGEIVWQSFDSPADTWLPGMNLTRRTWLTSWKSSSDPSPGRYSLRLKPPDYGEVELVFNGVEPYWSTGNWTGNSFSNVPQMTIPYIYKFHFVSPLTPEASFGFTEKSLEGDLPPPLTRFHLDSSGRLSQYTWASQTENWNMFWSQPENPCRVYGLCGNLGFCNSKLSNPCTCLAGFRPADGAAWDAGDFSSGCRRQSNDLCEANDEFEEIETVNSIDGAAVGVSISETQSDCERRCLRNCSCIGLYHNQRTNSCKILFESLLNLRNQTPDSAIDDDKLYIRVLRGGGRGTKGKSKKKALILTLTIFGVSAIIITIMSLLFLRRRRLKVTRKKEEEESVFPVTNLKVFSYKELQAATRGFSEKLGHGGFGAVFRGELSDDSVSVAVAVKRLERPGGAEREFRAEVCTIGNIQHVNLVRLRGFCSENSHRLLVYDYMPNGPLSVYLKRDNGGKSLDWDVRFRIAIGTARGIAYLHEECRDCIIHCDIKPENILLDEDFSAKISDFGLAKLVCRDMSRVLATMRGTWGYVAPEWISGVAITAKADVYSYGMTLLELIGGRRNVEGGPGGSGGGDGGGNGEKSWFFPPWAARRIIEGNVEDVLDERLGGNYDLGEAVRVGLVAVWCIQDDEATRPTMGMVVKMLEGVVEVAVPPPPKLLQALVSGESFHGVVVADDDDDDDIDLGKRVCSSNFGGHSDGNVQHSLDAKDLKSSPL